MLNKIWDKVNNSIKKGFNSEPVHKEKYLKTKLISYKGKIRTNFHDGGIPKENSHGSQVVYQYFWLILK